MDNFLLVSIILIGVVVVFQMGLFIYFGKVLKSFLERIISIPEVNLKNNFSQGAIAPSFGITDYSGDHINVGKKMKEDVILIFISSTCQTCRALIDKLNLNMIPTEKVIFITNDSFLDEKYFAKLSELNIPIIVKHELFSKYFISQTPSLVYVNDQGIIQYSGVVHSWSDINKKLKQKVQVV